MHKIISLIIAVCLFGCAAKTDYLERCASSQTEITDWVYVESKEFKVAEIIEVIGAKNFNPRDGFEVLWYKKQSGDYAYCESSKKKEHPLGQACFSFQMYISKVDGIWQIEKEGMVYCTYH
jgi:hypothetical protein